MSVDDFLQAFDFSEELEIVIVDLTHSHIWDQAAVNAIDKVVLKFRRNGADVELQGLNEASATLLEKLAVHNDPDAHNQMASH